ncbi:MAG: SPFH domain-containing protein, partial [Oscillospiraceae bacterium]|nr:SPFH domain-containing protein [Oscillospiraceae bacterium]
MTNKTVSYKEEKLLSPKSGFPALILSSLLLCVSLAVLIVASVALDRGLSGAEQVWAIVAVSVSGAYIGLIGWLPLGGLKVIQPNEAGVYTLFGRYYGTIAKPGFFFIHPFCTMVPGEKPALRQISGSLRKVSLKAITLNNERQKINDRDGNP